MKVAIVGKKCKLAYQIGLFIPKEVTEIVVYDTKGISDVAKKYALSNNIKFVEFIPKQKKLFKKADYDKIDEFVDYVDLIIVVSYSRSKEFGYIIDLAHKRFKRMNFILEGIRCE